MKYILILEDNNYIIVQRNGKFIGKGVFQDSHGKTHGAEYVFNNIIGARIKQERLNGRGSKRTRKASKTPA